MTYHRARSGVLNEWTQMQQQFEPRFSLQELTDATGVPKRTVRYYITEGVVPVSEGKGRSAYYTSEHVSALARVKDLRQQNLSIEEIRQVLEDERTPALHPASGDIWRRIQLHSEIELLVRDGAPEHVTRFVQHVQSTASQWFDRNDPE
jgi:DNA-binding transcriptional MerR regulator